MNTVDTWSGNVDSKGLKSLGRDYILIVINYVGPEYWNVGLCATASDCRLVLCISLIRPEYAESKGYLEYVFVPHQVISKYLICL